MEEIFTDPLKETRQGASWERLSGRKLLLTSSFGKKREETKVDDGTHSFCCSVIYIFNDFSSKIKSDILNVLKKMRDG